MRDYLTALAERLIGPPSVRPRLRSRYAEWVPEIQSITAVSEPSGATDVSVEEEATANPSVSPTRQVGPTASAGVEGVALQREISTQVRREITQDTNATQLVRDLRQKQDILIGKAPTARPGPPGQSPAANVDLPSSPDPNYESPADVRHPVVAERSLSVRDGSKPAPQTAPDTVRLPVSQAFPPQPQPGTHEASQSGAALPRPTSRGQIGSKGEPPIERTKFIAAERVETIPGQLPAPSRAVPQEFQERPRLQARTRPSPAQVLLSKAPSKAEPTIEISIGTIEVHAASPARRVEKNRPVQKTSSLEEYLQRVRGGKG